MLSLINWKEEMDAEIVKVANDFKSAELTAEMLATLATPPTFSAEHILWFFENNKTNLLYREMKQTLVIASMAQKKLESLNSGIKLT